jgi:hypothetical protein
MSSGKETKDRLKAGNTQGRRTIQYPYGVKLRPKATAFSLAIFINISYLGLEKLKQWTLNH